MNFLAGSFRVGRLFGIDVRVHVIFVLWIAFELFSAHENWRDEAIFLGTLFGIVLIHEFGHCFGARSVGGDARQILMWPLGGLAFAAAPMRPWPQFVTVACGPLVNVIFCVLSGAGLLVLTHDLHVFRFNPESPINYHALVYGLLMTGHTELPTWVPYLAAFYRVNYMLLVFNLLPIYPLDGGQLFHAILWPFVGLYRATFIACYVGIAGASLLAIWALRSGGGGMLIAIAIFGGLTCYQRLLAARHGLLVEDAEFTVYNPRRRGPGWLARLLRRRPASPPPRPEASAYNPNPGGWQVRMHDEHAQDGELDRILKKVHEQGLHSLSYVERQTLQQATRERQAREQQIERDTRT